MKEPFLHILKEYTALEVLQTFQPVKNVLVCF